MDKTTKQLLEDLIVHGKSQHEISRLLHFARQKGLIAPEDEVYAANRLLDVLHVEDYVPKEVDETLETATPILECMLDYAAEKGLIEGTTDERDLFDTRIMDCVMPRPSEVVRQFHAHYEESPREATDYYYALSIASNYIRKARIDKNIAWKTATEFGDLDVTINLSKPEKDPRDIAKAKLAKAADYPKCLLCRENEGYAGRVNHPARETHRLIPLDLAGHPWFLQYSPYTYYNEHCIVLNSDHVPMVISRETFENLTAFLEIFPHYFAGSNADLPIVGGSILSHDHYQGGRYTFAMERAAVEQEYTFANYPQVRAGRVKWPMSTLRLTSSDKDVLVELATAILAAWRTYSDASAEILAETDAPHNTITPIARRRGARPRARIAQCGRYCRRSAAALRISVPAIRRDEAASDDRHCARRFAAPAHCRRTDDGARCDDSGADSRPAVPDPA